MANEEGKWISIYKLKNINSHIVPHNENYTIRTAYKNILTELPLSVNFEYIINQQVLGDIKIIKHEQEIPPRKDYTIKDYVHILGCDILGFNTSDLKIKISEEMYNDLMEIYSYAKRKNFEYNDAPLANEKKE
jgi:hypothetical protein